MLIDVLIPGRPEPGTRTPREESCYDFLDELGISYLRADHDHANTMEDLEPARKLLGCTIYKNLFLTNRQQTEFYLLVMPALKPFKTKYLSKQLGTARLSFAGPEDMERILDVTLGSASILALKNDTEHKVHLVLDTDVRDEPYFGCHPCLNTTSLKLTLEDVLTKIFPATGHTPTWVELPWDPE